MEDLRDQFNQLGMRFTAQRRMIYELFESSPRGLTVAEAAAALKDRNVGEVTIYRTIRALQDIGRLQWVHDENGEHRFVACSSVHSHPVACRRCGRVVQFRTCEMSILEKLLSLETGFAIEGHHLEFYGICPACRADNDKKDQ